jgi:ubiquitin-like protein Pup
MPSEKQQEYRDHPINETEEIQPDAELNKNVDELTEDLDALLDEIDEILEEDSEEFVENYIQRGGQ